MPIRSLQGSHFFRRNGFLDPGQAAEWEDGGMAPRMMWLRKWRGLSTASKTWISLIPACMRKAQDGSLETTVIRKSHIRLRILPISGESVYFRGSFLISERRKLLRIYRTVRRKSYRLPGHPSTQERKNSRRKLISLTRRLWSFWKRSGKTGWMRALTEQW